MMSTEKNRNVTSKVAVGFNDGKRVSIFIGEIKGEIAERLRGPSSFGWDPIFIPQGYDKTFAELGLEIKNTLSARSIALKKFKQFLEE
jgi:XTP/dITP diphosphohydrolase